ncbi:hypothetical protein I215_06927 [Galbibacter marinus]|uniref:Type 9 secretion system plug protein N-terminal domain-containing protein n=1 Tax=Galbibacter marinus TaxID=555500 RepID=K2PVA4_9FLAO|nr:DUF5103 domain-containing protein [Galbibacter marinus]EKF55424.1 hypothetical protein I215_06927 [Galbibacter marinus]
MKFTFVLFCIGIFKIGFSQIVEEKGPPENIKSIIFKSDKQGDQFPIVKLGQTIQLSFDDLYADEMDYYYRIVYCNYDWTPSRLLKSQYLDGIDDLRITNYANSLTTLQPYTNYQLQLPNSQTKFKITGNYVLEVTDSKGELLFSRRFVVYKESVQVGLAVKTSKDVKNLDKMQRLEIIIDAPDFELINPKQDVKVIIYQNGNFNHSIKDVSPQFISGSQLLYRYEKETSFEGGNEYLWFDTKEIRTASNSIAMVESKNRYYHYLYPDEIRKGQPYTYNPDINGDFEIRTIDAGATNSDREADYSFVYFSLPYNNEIGLDNIYVYGKFNNYQLTEENRLKIDQENQLLQTPILLKQGFYNYKYVKVGDKNQIVDYNYVSGSHWETENNYTVLVYYREFGKTYDSVIGMGSASSQTISN